MGRYVCIISLTGKVVIVYIILGDVQLKNLVLKPSALDDLDLPLQTVYGTIGNYFDSLRTFYIVVTVNPSSHYKSCLLIWPYSHPVASS